ncbi:MAG: hypothetical protein LIO79_07950 [Rikenellaceae bacterium]|nr:hypothetical protein [Rikenellaceae bacterium]
MEYLAGIGIRPAKDRGYYGMYKSPFRDEQTASMKVDFEKNLWIDYGSRDGGTLIDLVMRLERCDAGQAMRLLEQMISGSPSFSFHGNSSPTPKREPAITIEPVKPINNPALITYLKERGINVDIAKVHCPEVHYSVAGKPYFAIGFRNDERVYELPILSHSYWRSDSENRCGHSQLRDEPTQSERVYRLSQPSNNLPRQ